LHDRRLVGLFNKKLISMRLKETGLHIYKPSYDKLAYDWGATIAMAQPRTGYE
jgi:hypothetical protein